MGSVGRRRFLVGAGALLAQPLGANAQAPARARRRGEDGPAARARGRNGGARGARPRLPDFLSAANRAR